MIYLLMAAVYGLVLPLIFILTGRVDIVIPSVISIGFSAILLSALALFRNREMQEELGLMESDVEDLQLRYITHRLTNGEIRQNYYFFGHLREDRSLESTEGNLSWIPFEEVPSLEMPVSAKHMILHYLREGRFTDHIYCGITEEESTSFVIMREF